ncbi:MAG: hypothetical protein HY710_14755 [Candidatus Latescibacteria bacterium]|nr:hypothetical protein [Candidatus Latescibacterota bacterium]
MLPNPPVGATTAVLLVPGASRLVFDCGAFRMQLDVSINSVLIRRCRYISTGDGRTPWVSPPADTYTDERGRLRYFPLCVFPPDAKPRLVQLAQAEYRRLRIQQGGKTDA